MKAWVQRHDLSYKEFEINSAKEAVAFFENYDWASEIQKLITAEERNEDDICPPGFGLVSEDDFILHLCPTEKGDCLVHFHYKKVMKLLFMFKFDLEDVKSTEDVGWNISVSLIPLFFERNWSGILNEI